MIRIMTIIVQVDARDKEKEQAHAQLQSRSMLALWCFIFISYFCKVLYTPSLLSKNRVRLDPTLGHS